MAIRANYTSRTKYVVPEAIEMAAQACCVDSSRPAQMAAQNQVEENLCKKRRCVTLCDVLPLWADMNGFTLV